MVIVLPIVTLDGESVGCVALAIVVRAIEPVPLIGPGVYEAFAISMLNATLMDFEPSSL